MKNESLKILFTPLNLFLSHVTRSLAIAEALRENGHQVEFICGEINREFIQKSGFKIHSVHDLPLEKIMISGAPIEYVRKFYGDKFEKCIKSEVGFRKMLEDDLTILSGFQPDLIVSDHHPTSLLSAQLMDIPCVSINNLVGYVMMYNYKIEKEKGIDRNYEIDYTVETEMREEMVQMLKTNPRFKVPKLWSEDMPVIIPGIPHFECHPGANTVPAPFHWFVGMLHWKGWDKMFKPDKEKYKNTINILITLGSSFPFRRIIKHIVDAFKGDKYRILINTGDQFRFSDADNESASNVEILPFIHLVDYLDISNVVVYHGGHGTAMEVLQAGVPAVVIPFNGDQMEITKRLEFFKCARRIKKYPDDISLDEIKAVIDEVLTDETYKYNAKKLGNELKKWPDGAQKAAIYIERFAKKSILKKKAAAELGRIKSGKH
jgi:MGT family glycosyltransferase